MLTQSQLANYKGSTCPFCGATDITGGHVDLDEFQAWQDVTCNACGSDWQDLYTRTRIEDRRTPNQPTQTLPKCASPLL